MNKRNARAELRIAVSSTVDRDKTSLHSHFVLERLSEFVLAVKGWTAAGGSGKLPEKPRERPSL
jgi:hypothetical protein